MGYTVSSADVADDGGSSFSVIMMMVCSSVLFYNMGSWVDGLRFGYIVEIGGDKKVGEAVNTVLEWPVVFGVEVCRLWIWWRLPGRFRQG